MKSISKILFVALVIGAYCCSSKGDGSVTIVDVGGNKMAVFSLNNLKSDTATIALSSLVESCSLVQLSSNEEAYCHPWFTTVTEKYIGVRQRSGRPYMLFDRSGKFLCQVGSVGRGPGEYSISLYDDIIDDKTGLIFLAGMTGDRILVYNTSGQHVKDIVAPQRLQKPKLFLSDGFLTVVHMPFKNDKAVALQFDVNTGQVVKELAPPAHLLVESFDGEIFNTRNVQGTFDFTHTGSDTLYHFDTEKNKIRPLFTMTYSSSEKPYKQYYLLNEHMILTNVFGKGLVATDLKSMTSSYIKVVNDFYGNMPAPTYIVQLRNGYWVHNIQPEQLIEDIEKRLAKSSCSENDRQTLNKTLSTLKEGANNVVFVGKLKNEVKSSKLL